MSDSRSTMGGQSIEGVSAALLLRQQRSVSGSQPLYTPEQRVRRDASVWTLVQGILAPIQFVIFLVSLWLVIHCLRTGEGETAATVSVIVKTLALYTIMITGAIWEKDVFGRYLFAPAFYWEDVFSMLVLTLHTAYLLAVYTGALGLQGQMVLALAAYTTYVINAGQFIWKLRMARLDHARSLATTYPAPSDAAGAAR